MSAPKSERTAPSEEEMTPPVYEEGSNVGPNISQSLDCEHLDADLFRSNQVGPRKDRRGSIGLMRVMNIVDRNCGNQRELEVCLVVK
jgi:hypothetical protein